MLDKGLILVVSGPSGVGKGTVVDRLLQGSDNLKLCVSVTTREARIGEQDGKDYIFRTVDEFSHMIEEQELVEWVEYCGNYYGTPRKCIDQLVNDNYDVILEIEVEGALNIKKIYKDSILVFVMPPNFDELIRRVNSRGTDRVYSIERRLVRAKHEMMLIYQYDYVVINDNIDEAAKDILMILSCEKLRISRNHDTIRGVIGQ